MATQFNGYPGIKHLAQPPETDFCFATIVAAFTKEDAERTHGILVENELSDQDGATPSPFAKVELEGLITIDPIVTPFEASDDAETAVKRIYKEFDDKQPVALLHKKNDIANDEQYHWLLLTGRYNDGEDTLAIGVMDPLEDRRTYIEATDLEDIIDRSINFMGVYACSLSLSQTEK